MVESPQSKKAPGSKLLPAWELSVWVISLPLHPSFLGGPPTSSDMYAETRKRLFWKQNSEFLLCVVLTLLLHILRVFQMPVSTVGGCTKCSWSNGNSIYKTNTPHSCARRPTSSLRWHVKASHCDTPSSEPSTKVRRKRGLAWWREKHAARIQRVYK